MTATCTCGCTPVHHWARGSQCRECENCETYADAEAATLRARVTELEQAVAAKAAVISLGVEALDKYEARVAELEARTKSYDELFEGSLDCEHCGDVAVISAQNMYWDGDFARCLSCGHPGQIHADETAYFTIADEETDWCDREDCAECIERKNA